MNRLSCLLILAGAVHAQFLYGTFPPGFEWGSATSAHQIEGAWDTNGKGENIWDHMSHDPGCLIAECANADVASDSYNRFTEDIAALKETGVHFYRFSLAWSRILPTGRTDVINQDGIDYYNRLIDALLVEGIRPLVTLYHWDLPQPLQEEFGGWTDETIVEIFASYSRIAFQNFGDRVKSWLTFNEPWVICELGYGYGSFAPRVVGSGITDYQCAHNLLKSHARAWHIYNDEFRPTQNGECGITLDSGWFEPRTSSQEDIDAAERAIQFKLGWFAHPIFSATGDYPDVMKQYIAMHSAQEGYPESRLPVFDATWIEYIKGSFDFFGLNHYTTALAAYGDVIGTPPNYDNDMNVWQSSDPSWPGSAADWLKVVPWGFRNLLNWIKNEYNNPRLIVTENGFADVGELNDAGRVDYYLQYIDEMLKAVILDGCNVYGYTAWSIIDNFEWASGYTVRFGLYHVDFNNPARPRTQKESARFYAQVIRDNGFPAPPLQKAQEEEKQV